MSYCRAVFEGNYYIALSPQGRRTFRCNVNLSEWEGGYVTGLGFVKRYALLRGVFFVADRLFGIKENDFKMAKNQMDFLLDTLVPYPLELEKTAADRHIKDIHGDAEKARAAWHKKEAKADAATKKARQKAMEAEAKKALN